jgi:hypothetical protein
MRSVFARVVGVLMLTSSSVMRESPIGKEPFLETTMIACIQLRVSMIQMICCGVGIAWVVIGGRRKVMEPFVRQRAMGGCEISLSIQLSLRPLGAQTGMKNTPANSIPHAKPKMMSGINDRSPPSASSSLDLLAKGSAVTIGIGTGTAAGSERCGVSVSYISNFPANNIPSTEAMILGIQFPELTTVAIPFGPSNKGRAVVLRVGIAAVADRRTSLMFPGSFPIVT